MLLEHKDSIHVMCHSWGTRPIMDGDTIKASTSYDAVFQNGDEFYFGSVGSAPDGWTQLTPN